MSRIRVFWAWAIEGALGDGQRWLAWPPRVSIARRLSHRRAHEARQLTARRLEPRRMLDAALPGVLSAALDFSMLDHSTPDGTIDTVLVGGAQVGEWPGPAWARSVMPAAAGTPAALSVGDDGALSSPGSSAAAAINMGPRNVIVFPLGPAYPFAEAAENETVHALFVFQDPNFFDTHSVQVDWGDGSPVETRTLPAGQRLGLVSHQYLDDNPSGTPSDINQIQVTVWDSHGAAATGRGEIRINNVGPSNLQLTPLDPIDENSMANLQLTFEDPGTLDQHWAQVDWGDGSGVETWDVVPGSRSLRADHSYADNGLYTIQVQLFDDDLGVVAGGTRQQVRNVDPVLTGAMPVPTVAEGQAFTLASLGVRLADPGFDNPDNPLVVGGSVETFSALTVDWGDGSAAEVLAITDRANGGPGRPTTADFQHAAHTYADNGHYTVTVRMADDDNLAADQVVVRTLAIEVLNVAPTLALTTDPQVVDEGSLLTIANLGTFADPGFDNPHGAPATSESFSYTIDWGDGTVETSQLPVVVVPGSPGIGTTGALAASHRYLDNNVDALHQPIDYTVTVRLSDDDGGFSQRDMNVTVNNVEPTLITLAGTDIDRMGATTLSGSFVDPGNDTFVLQIDWRDGSIEQVPLGGPTPRDFLVTHRYFGPPDPLNPAADVEIGVRLLDDDRGFDTGLVAVSNTGDGTRPVRIDTTPQVPRLTFPRPVVVSPRLQSHPVNLEHGSGTDISSAVGDTKTIGERYFVLRVITPEGKQGAGYRLEAESLQDLSGLFRKLPDNHYAIYLVRPETETYRLVLEVNVRNGKVIDPGDDSDGARDRPPTESAPESVQPADRRSQEVERLPADSAVPSAAATPAAPTVPTGPVNQADSLDGSATDGSGAGVLSTEKVFERLPHNENRAAYPSQEHLGIAAGGIGLASAGYSAARSSTRLSARVWIQDSRTREIDQRLADTTPVRWRRLRRIAR